MEIQAVDIFTFCLFLIVSVVVLVIANDYIRYRQKNYDSGILTTFFYSKLSFEWKFLEEVTDELFLDNDQQLQDALKRIFGETYKMQTMQLMIVEQLCVAFFEKGLLTVDKVLYSKEEFERFPFLFKNLPEWRKEECKALAESQEEAVSGFDLTRIKKIPIGKPTKKKIKEEKESSLSGGMILPVLS
jgi:hypothetical protein